MAKILFVSTSTTVGGAEKTLFALATLLDHRAFPVAGVVSVKPEGHYARRLRDMGVTVESLNLTRAPRPADARRLAAIIERERPDIVHAVMYQAIQLARMAKPLTKVPFKLVSSPRVNYRSRSWWTLLLDRWLKERDDLLIAECEASRRFLLQKLSYRPSKVATIRNGVDLAGWPVSKIDRQKKRLELRLGAADVLVGAVGRLDRQKGFATLIEAMARLKGTALRCAILGDGPERDRLAALIRRHAVEKSVWLLGEKDEIPSWLSAFDAYCLPSLWEGLPNSLLEAMALGLPVVASNVDGVPEAVTDGGTGVLVPPHRPAALAKALQALAADAGRRAALGAAAKAAISERFTLRRMIEEYEQAYTGVTSRS
ncbi:MAG: glycosyltransferase [Elusimicrobia bacterium]|nr:glycosyltransferase [Elusimicrobiota bacterium]